MRFGNRLYGMIDEQTRARIDRLRYSLGLLPRIHKQKYYGNTPEGLYPRPFKSCLVISLDLELAWGWRFAKCGFPNPLGYALDRANQERRNFKNLLILFDKYNIPVTWAVVGHLFLERCVKVNMRAHPNLLRPPYFKNEYWCYTSGDWFDIDPGSNYLDAPAWYAPDLVHEIIGTRVKHEIACHSFSHIDFTDNICPTEVADSELCECLKVAHKWGLELKSFVFPGNFVGNLRSLKHHGFIAYRMWTGYDLDFLQRDAYGLWKIPEGKCLEKVNDHWTDAQWLATLQKHINVAISSGSVCSFWFHPSCHPATIEVVLVKLLEYINARRDDIWVTTMSGLAEFLTKVSK